MKQIRQVLGSWPFFVLVILLVWQGVSLLVHNAILCPSPWQVILAMKEQTLSVRFYEAVGMTLFRTVAGLLLSFLCAWFLALAAFFSKVVQAFLAHLITLLQAVPNIAYVILLLFWTSRQQTVLLVVFFLLFPMMYRNFQEELKAIRQGWKDVFLLYPQPWYVMMQQAFIPMLKPAILASLKSAASLGFKAGVMAEILASVPSGLGKLMQTARLNVNAAGVFGYVIWMLLLVHLLETATTWAASRFFGQD